jgi:hypothetical protein
MHGELAAFCDRRAGRYEAPARVLALDGHSVPSAKLQSTIQSRR